MTRYVLTGSCPDQVGVVAAVSRALAQAGCFIDRSRSYGDHETGLFCIRIEFHPTRGGFSRAAFEAAFAQAVAPLSMDWALRDADAAVKTLILVSKSDHCANALLYAARMGDAPITPVGILSNHRDLEGPLAHWDTPYHVAPVTPDTKPEAEARLFALIEETGAELIVLARYMQVLSDKACARLTGRCINIHHSFLPSFKGAKPYHQAHARGVKVIGATAHYVTPALDEGPIISQVTEPVDHAHSVADLIRLGRDLEARALVRAVAAHAAGRVFLNGGKTIVLS